MSILYMLFIIPFALAIAAVRTNFYPIKALVTLSCIAIILSSVFLYGSGHEYYYYIVAAFLLSIIGDYFLSTREKKPDEKENYFLPGIGFFFLAHGAYLFFSAREGSMRLFPLIVLITILALYFFLRLFPRIEGLPLKIALSFYLMISCFSMSLVLGYHGTGLAKACFITGIGLILFSDIAIGENLFCKKKSWKKWILPTYYAAHMSLTLGLLL